MAVFGDMMRTFQEAYPQLDRPIVSLKQRQLEPLDMTRWVPVVPTYPPSQAVTCICSVLPTANGSLPCRPLDG